MKPIVLSITLFITSLVPSGVIAEEGIWVPESNFAQVNVACIRTYTCTPKTDVMYGGEKKLVHSEPRLVTGVCNVGGGPADSCNECMTTPPSETCEWHLEPN
jgi:hypothetical protein